MKINTKYFDELSYEKKDIITFSDGLFGFEDQKEFIVIKFDNEDNSLLCLQSIKESGLAFVIVNPFSIEPDYTPALSKKDLSTIKADDDTPITFYTICVVQNNIKNTTINLRCPIVVNLENNMAKQFILEETDYSFKHPFIHPEKKED